MYFKNPFKDKDDIYFFAAIICTAIANGVVVGLPKSNIIGLTAILAFTLNMFITKRGIKGIPLIILAIIIIYFYLIK
ncbi:MAG TPA: hypothetical protein DHV06_04880 [Bacteroides thetaiotaomicron]|nr:hypothetical protein [Bacteroides thetaiotaomicron]